MLPVLFLSLLAVDGSTLSLVRTMDPVPEDSDVFLSRPLDMTVDGKNRVYVVDSEANTVFVWEGNGSYVGTFGQEGTGPGEFSFMGRGGPQAYLGVDGDNIVVYDGGRRTINTFAADLTYVGSVPFQLKGGRGRTQYFKVTAEGQYVINATTWGESARQTVGLYDREGELINQISDIQDKSFKRNGNRRGFTINAFAPRTVVVYDDFNKQVVVGNSEAPNFNVFGLDGKLVKTVKVPLAQKEVTKEDIAEYKEIPWIKRSGFVQPAFPDKKAFYTHILPMADGSFLVFDQSPYYRNAEGIQVNKDGAVKKRFRYSCGEDGGLFAADGRLFALATDDEGEFGVHELRLD
ncbi:MAG: 6-bladed beta-propeller [Acidobacteriota bacterium]|nr:6-bladed beta-propeller [Acidobacteriota bacterium]